MMKKAAILLLLLLAGVQSRSQTSGSSWDEKQPVFRYVEQMPVAPYDVNKYMADNMQYSEEAIANDEHGRIVTDFVITTSGDAVNITVRNAFKYPNLAKEAARLVDNMPAWKPGVQNGKPVNVAMSLPIVFWKYSELKK